MPRPVNIADETSIWAWLCEVSEGRIETARLLSIAIMSSLKKRPESAVELRELPDNAPDWLKNKWDTCGPFHAFRPDAGLKDKVRHIRDWLDSARHHDAPFLKNLDDKGRPKKLVQLNLDRAYREANDYFAQLNRTFNGIAEDDRDTETVMRFDGGYRVVRLLTPGALKVEGPAMGHCIGGGAYDERLGSNLYEYYSLRDPANKPHVTFEIEARVNRLIQCRGKENKAPVQKYTPFVRDFVEKMQFKLDEDAWCTGLLQDINGVYHSIYDLPKGLETADLDLEHAAIASLPENMKVRGDLWLEHSTLPSLPKGLEVHGDLCLNHTGIDVLPDDLKVTGNIDASETQITAIPDALKKIDGYLDLFGSPVSALPEGMDVDCLDLGGTLITALPAKLTVHSDLDLQELDIAALPEDISIGGCLNLTGTQVTALPASLKKINGDLELEDSSILSLPDDFEVGGTLILNRTRINKLPKGLKVGQHLHIENTAVTVLPDDLKVEGRVFTNLGEFQDLESARERFIKHYGAPLKRRDPHGAAGP